MLYILRGISLQTRGLRYCIKNISEIFLFDLIIVFIISSLIFFSLIFFPCTLKSSKIIARATIEVGWCVGLHNQLQRRVELRFLPLPNEASRKANTQGQEKERRAERSTDRHRGSWMFVSRILCVSVSCTRTSCVPRTAAELKSTQKAAEQVEKADRSYQESMSKDIKDTPVDIFTVFGMRLPVPQPLALGSINQFASCVCVCVRIIKGKTKSNTSVCETRFWATENQPEERNTTQDLPLLSFLLFWAEGNHH